MHRAEKPNDRLRAFARAVDSQHDLPAELEHLLELAVRAVPACVAVTVLLPGAAAALALTALLPGAGDASVRASLAIELPRSASQAAPARPTLVLYARVARAFDGIVPSLLALLDLSHRDLTVDAHLELPDTIAQSDAWTRQLEDEEAVSRAIGVLLDRGMLPADGHRELRRLAARDAVSTVAAARALVAGVTRTETAPDPPGPDGPSS